MLCFVIAIELEKARVREVRVRGKGGTTALSEVFPRQYSAQNAVNSPLNSLLSSITTLRPFKMAIHSTPLWAPHELAATCQSTLSLTAEIAFYPHPRGFSSQFPFGAAFVHQATRQRPNMRLARSKTRSWKHQEHGKKPLTQTNTPV